MSAAVRSRTTPVLVPSKSAAILTGSLLLSIPTCGASEQAELLCREIAAFHKDRSVPIAFAPQFSTDSKIVLRERFAELASRWRAETRFLSSTTEIAMHPAYQAIIGMGQDALPLILEDLRGQSGHWYWALKAISHEDPVPPSDRGAVKKMKAAWLRWGQARGLIAA